MAWSVGGVPKRLLAVSALIVIVAVAGILAILTHHRDLGRSLVELSVVLTPLDLVLARRLRAG